MFLPFLPPNWVFIPQICKTAKLYPRRKCAPHSTYKDIKCRNLKIQKNQHPRKCAPHSTYKDIKCRNLKIQKNQHPIITTSSIATNITNNIHMAVMALMLHRHPSSRGHTSRVSSPSHHIYLQNGGPQWWSITVCCGWVSIYLCVSSSTPSMTIFLLLGSSSGLLLVYFFLWLPTKITSRISKIDCVILTYSIWNISLAVILSKFNTIILRPTWFHGSSRKYHSR